MGLMTEDTRVMQTRSVTCMVCGQAFAYRYIGRFDGATLLPVDRLCRRCFGPWTSTWARQHRWV